MYQYWLFDPFLLLDNSEGQQRLCELNQMGTPLIHDPAYKRLKAIW